MEATGLSGSADSPFEDQRDEPFDIEALSKAGQEVPEAARDRARYKIRIDKQPHVLLKRHISGAGLLALVGKTPESHWLDQKMRDGSIVRVGPIDQVDLGKPGVERFMTIALTETDGSLLALPQSPELS